MLESVWMQHVMLVMTIRSLGVILEECRATAPKRLTHTLPNAITWYTTDSPISAHARPLMQAPLESKS